MQQQSLHNNTHNGLVELVVRPLIHRPMLAKLHARLVV